MGKRELDFNDSFTSASSPTTTQIITFRNVFIGDASQSLTTHASWAAYLADAPVAGDRVTVIFNQVIDSDVDITISGILIEHFPNITYTGTANNPITISGDRVNWDGGRFSAFNTAGDKALTLAVAGDFNVVGRVRFNDCDTDLNDLSATSVNYGNINETP